MQNEIKKIIFLPHTVKIYKIKEALIFNVAKQYISINIPSEISLSRQGSLIIVEAKKKSAYLTTWSFLFKNILLGLTRNFSERLHLKGVGFKASQIASNILELKIGYSHTLIHKNIIGTKIDVSKNILLHVKSPLKNLVGQEAANLQKLRMPDIYKGKGILYKGENLTLKIGKKA